jgi:hypothetical protein
VAAVVAELAPLDLDVLAVPGGRRARAGRAVVALVGRRTW